MKAKATTQAFEELQRRVRSRVAELAELGETPTSLALKYGLGKDYIRDIISEKPRKTSISFAKMPRLAAALRADEEYLTSKQDVPQKPRAAETARPMVPLGGKLKVGRWDEPRARGEITLITGIYEPGVTIDVAYVQEDETLAELGIHVGMILYAERGGKSNPGDVVIIRRKMGSAVELSARVKTASGKHALGAQQEAVPVVQASRTQSKETEIAVVHVTKMLLKKKNA